MRVYLITGDQVTVHTSLPKPPSPDSVVIQSTKDLDSHRFPVNRLIAIWNGLPGAVPIKKFQSRAIAVKRLWVALEKLPLSTSGRRDSKQARVAALISRPQGASLDELMAATGWQRHTVRGVLSGSLRKKLGLSIEAVREKEGTTYRLGPS